MGSRRLPTLALVAGVACSEPRPVEVVLIGDSITQGVVSEPAGPPYAALLTRALGHGYEVVNLGCSGSSSLDWRFDRSHFACVDGEPMHHHLYSERVPAALPADLAVLMLGTNDALGNAEPTPVAADAYGDAIAALCARLLDEGAKQVMLLPPPPLAHDAAAQARILAYRAEIEARCAAPCDSILCGPDATQLLGADDFAPGDPHPNGRGHAKLAESLRAAITAAVPSRVR